MVRRAVGLIVLVLIGGLLVYGWGRAVVLRPIQVVGPSMAPSLRGSHLELTCVDCGCPFSCAADYDDDSQRPAICPNCGYPQPEAGDATARQGDRLEVDTLAYRLARPRRWQLVVFRNPQQPATYCIKRIVGLPGEAVEIRDGDVWIDGARVRKSLPEQRRLSVPVFDSRYRPHLASGTPPRWRPAATGSNWTAAGDGFRCAPRRGGTDITDWLQYSHWRRLPREPNRFEPAAICDDDPYDRASSRRLNEVGDLLLVARLRVAGTGRILFRADVRGQQYFVAIEPQRGRGRLTGRGDSRPLAEFDVAGDALLPLLAQTATVEFSTVDHQVLLAVDGRLLIDYACPESREVAHESPSPLAIGAEGVAIEIERLRLLRDVYYTDAGGPGGRFGSGRPWKLGADEYFVLGDNSPVSLDSRTGYPAGGLAARFLVGRPTGDP